MNGPHPSEKHPMEGFPRVCFIANAVKAPNVEIGDYTYYDDPEGPEAFAKNILYHYPFIGDKLVIGKFCAIAQGVRFIMNGANHRMSGFSTYPFGIFRKGWEAAIPTVDELPYKGDTIVGNDVWLGYRSLIMPGVHIGNGAIVGAGSVVTKEVPPYAVVGGNPAKVLKLRFPSPIVNELQAIAWWNWDASKITRNLSRILSADIAALRGAE